MLAVVTPHPASAAETAETADFKAAPPRVDQAAMASGREANAVKQWGRATARLQRVVAKTPAHDDAHNLLGFSYRWPRSHG